MQDLAAVRLAIRNTLFAAVPTIESTAGMFAPENRPMDVDLELYVSERMRIDSERRATIGQNGLTQADGTYFFYVVVRRGEGTEGAEALAKLIADAFEPGVDITIPGGSPGLDKVAVDRVERKSSIEWDAAYWAYPVEITIRHYAPAA